MTGGTAVIDECGVCGQPAIAGAAISSIDHTTQTIVIATADATIEAGQIVRLGDASESSCGAPGGMDLEVQSVGDATITIVSGLLAGAGDCVLIRRALCDDCAGVRTAMYCSSNGLQSGQTAGTVQRAASGAWECSDGNQVVFSEPGPNSEDECGTCDADDTNDCVANCLGLISGAGYPAGAGLLPGATDPLVDACGICDGDDSTCADCLTVPNGDAVRDDCGVCD